jgi:hypothetical protein
MDPMVLEAILDYRIQFMRESLDGCLFTHFGVNGPILEGIGVVTMQIAG